ncbi:hypothetical protein KCU98_g5464, partial [Aureobasidium melanogenum]
MAIKKGNMGGTRQSPRRRGGWRAAINRIEHRAMRVAFAPSRAATTTIEPRAPVDFSFGVGFVAARSSDETLMHCYSLLRLPPRPHPLSLLAIRFCAGILLLPWDGEILLLLLPPLALAPPTCLWVLCLLVRCHHEISKQEEEEEASKV